MSATVAKSPTLSVIVLAFNERANLPDAIKELVGTLDTTGVAYELLIVDDGSSDGTGEVADTIARAHADVRVIHHPANGGLGAGYRTGFSEARGHFVSFFPADRQFPSAIIEQFLPYVDRHDLVLGYLPDRRASWVGRFLSWVERLLYDALFGKLPRFQGIFMVRRGALATIELRSHGRGWAIVMEMIIQAKSHGLSIVSVPTAVRPRAEGKSKVNNLRTIAANVSQVMALRRNLRNPAASDRSFVRRGSGHRTTGP